MSVHQITQQALKFLQSQPWAPERRVSVELSCAGVASVSEYGLSRSQYIHTTGGGDTVTLRISDHKYGEHRYEILTSASRGQIQFTLYAYAAACACLSPYDEASEKKLSEAEWRENADHALHEFDRAAIADKVLDIIATDETENGSSGLPSIEELMEFVEDEDAQVYGALQHLASMNQYLRTHLHRLDANDPKTFGFRDQRDWTIKYYDKLFLAEHWSESVSYFECDEFLAEIAKLYHEYDTRS